MGISRKVATKQPKPNYKYNEQHRRNSDTKTGNKGTTLEPSPFGTVSTELLGA